MAYTSGPADAAPVPELVAHVPAQADRQHDAGRVVHRESRQPPEPPPRDARRRRQHEPPRRARARLDAAAVEHQLAGRRGRRTSRFPMRDSTATSPRRCGSGRSTRTSTGAACPPGKSQYHAMEFVLERRFSRGLQARVGYTYSRLKNNGAETGQGNDGRNGGIQNPADPLPWMLSDDDTPHVLLTGFSLGGARTAIRRRQLVPGRLERRGHPALRERASADDHDEQRSRRAALQHPEAAQQDRSGRRGRRQRLRSVHRRLLGQADAWTDPGPLQFGNAPKRDGDVRGFPNFSEDINIFKVFPMRRSDESPVRAADRQPVRPDHLLQRRTRTGARGISARCSRSATTPRSVQFGFRVDF